MAKLLSGTRVYGNLTVDTFATVTGNVTSSGNVAGTYLLGNVFFATGFSASKIYNGTSEVNIGTSGGAANVSIGGTSNVVVISSTDVAITGNLSVSGNATLSGNILGDRLQNGTTSIDIQTASGNANITVAGTSNVVVFSSSGQNVAGYLTSSGNITGGNLLTGGLISATGNITSAANVAGGNILATTIVSGASHIGTIVSVSANITGGNILTSGLISATGNITSAANVAGGNVLATTIVSGASHIGSIVSVSANITGGNVLATTIVSGASHIGSIVSVSANITGGNILTGGLVSSTGNITSAANVSGGNVLATTIVSGASLLGSIVSASANITGGNILTSGIASAASHIGSIVSVSANITGGNILTGGLVSSTGNITSAANILGGNLLTTGTGGSISGSGNITAGNILTSGILSATSNIYSGSKALIGVSSTTLTNPVAVFSGSGASYDQVAIINSTGTGSADLAIYANNGDDSQSWVDVGFTGNVFSDTNYSITAPGDGYLFAQGNTATGGNLVISTGNIGNTRDIVFGFGFLSTNEFVRFQKSTNTILPYANTTANIGSTTKYINNLYAVSHIGSVVTATGNVTGGNLTTAGQLVSSIATGTAPLVITSTTKVTNLNVEQVDGYHADTANTVNTIAVRDAAANITAANFNGTGVSVSGNVTGANLVTSGSVSSIGNIYVGTANAGYVFGNATYMTGISTAISVTKIENGNSNVWVNSPGGDVTVTAGGVSNVAVFSTGSMTLQGAFGTPKTITANVVVAENINAMLIGPLVFSNGYGLTVPTSSTVYVYSPNG